MYLDMIKAGGKTCGDAATKVFDQLKPIAPWFLVGKWDGGDFNTGHPVSQVLKDVKWASKLFHSEDEVYPVIIYGERGERTLLST
ncbi:GXWXG protein-domain-containing protein [Mycena galopus ATCC 62051]|nr:GXWXG protein-domain-containing protein [Mycena galopus ATCC 62051]